MDMSLFAIQDEGVKKIYEAILKNGRTFVVTDETLYNQSNFPSGNLSVNETISGSTSKYFLRVKDSATVRGFTIDELLPLESVTTNYIKDSAVTTSKIQNYSITSNKFAAGSVDTNSIKSKSVTTDKIKEGAIVNSHINDNVIAGNKIISLNGDKLDNGSITSLKYAAGSVLESVLANNVISEIKVKDNAIVTRHICTKAIISSHLNEKIIKSIHLDDKCVLNNHVSDNAIATINIRDENITSSKIAANSVLEKHINDLSVTYWKLNQSLRTFVDNSIKPDAANDYTITRNFNSSGQIKSNKLVANSIEIANSAVFKSDISSDGSLKIKGDVIPLGKTYNAFYKDLAEAYVPGEKLEPGDIVEIRNNNKVYKTQGYSDRIVGVVSDQYATCFGALPEELQSGKKVAVALIGQVPVKVFGRVVIGQYIEPGKDGTGHPSFGKKTCCVGKAIECKSCEGISYVRCLIFPN